ncbi:sulfite exporter TauE/SafE family protein [Sorangium sp. So ce295]|uniref:TSUP family transporter n=1 Tax=Sorangium sp. So ce295 TaxID=3133295 RepID=UPI003F624B28
MRRMSSPRRSPIAAFQFGAPIGTLGGLIGLGGAEFRLPVLKANFGYPAARAVALNLEVSLITLAASLVARLRVTGVDPLIPLAPVLLALVAGSMVGAYLGASYAARIPAAKLERWIFVLLVAIGLALMVEAFVPWRRAARRLPRAVRTCGRAQVRFGGAARHLDLGRARLPPSCGLIDAPSIARRTRARPERDLVHEHHAPLAVPKDDRAHGGRFVELHNLRRGVTAVLQDEPRAHRRTVPRAQRAPAALATDDAKEPSNRL